YPYTEDELAAGVRSIFKLERFPTLDCMVGAGDANHARSQRGTPSTILVTHCGPAGVGTTDINKTPFAASTTREETGSTALGALLSQRIFQTPLGLFPTAPGTKKTKSMSHIALHVHGHSHASWGVSHLGIVPIINPGPLRDGRFAVAEIEQGLDEHFKRKWRLVRVEFGVV
ncbi:hypothetical protein BDK51DRAFT_29714, partial [Blyttiomyces helicus]